MKAGGRIPHQIAQAEESLRALLNASTESAFLMEIDGTVVAANEVAAKRLGTTARAMEGANAYDLIPPDIAASRKGRIKEAIRTGKPIRFEDVRLGRIIDQSVHPVIGPDGTVARLAIFATDVTEQRNAEAALIASETHLREIIAEIKTGIVVHAPDTSITLINPFAEELLGIRAARATGEKADSGLWKFISEEGSDLPLEMYPVNQVLAHGRKLEKFVMGVVPPDHETPPRWFIVNAYPILRDEAIHEVVVSFMDMTERKLTEDRIRKLNQELQLYEFALSVADEAIFMSRRDARIAYVNRAACRNLGYEEAELLGMSIGDIDENYRKGQWDKHWAELRRLGSMRIESVHRRRDGTVFPVEISVNYLKYMGEEFDLGIARDVTERKAAAEELAYSQRYLKSIVDNEPECVKLIEPDGTLIEMNPSGLAMIDADSLEQVRGQSVMGIVAPEHREAFAALTKRVCAGATGTLLFRIVGLKGTEKWLETHAVPFHDEKRNRTVLLGVTRDVTEKKKYEDALKQTIAENEMLMREIYHRTKNNLAVIQSLLKLQYRDIKDEEAKGKFRESEDRVRSMSMIHEQLYRSSDLKTVRLHEYLRNLSTKLAGSYTTADSGVRIEMDVPEIKIDVNAIIPIGLIVNELVTNALKYAFPKKGGVIGISIKETTKDITLSVRDNGIGLPEGLDIYHTSSLGMQIVTSLAAQMDAELTVQSRQGTAVTLVLKKAALDKK